MRHHTTDPAIRAQHISDRIEAETFKKRVEACLDGMILGFRGCNPLNDWPQREIDTYQQTLRELAHERT